MAEACGRPSWPSRAHYLGTDAGGRALIVALYHQSGRTWKIIGAKEMTTDELAQFAKWEERDE